MDLLRIEKLQVDCIVGVYPNERHLPQRLEIDLAFGLDTRVAAHSDQLRDTIDYAWIVNQTEFLLRHAQFQLLESAASALCHLLLLPALPDEQRPTISHASAKLTKPDALNGVAIPSLTMHRDLPECDFRTEQRAAGQIDTLHQSARRGIYRVSLAPQTSLNWSEPSDAAEVDLLLSNEISNGEQAFRRGAIFPRERGQKSEYVNRSAHWQSLLCIARPGLSGAIELRQIPGYTRSSCG